jgi:hypothetical protein
MVAGRVFGCNFTGLNRGTSGGRNATAMIAKIASTSFG